MKLADWNDELFVQRFNADMPIYPVQCEKLFKQLGRDLDRVNTPLSREIKASIVAVKHNGWGSFEVLIEKEILTSIDTSEDEISAAITESICETEVALAMLQVHSFDPTLFESGLEAAEIYIAVLEESGYEFDLDSLKADLHYEVQDDDIEKAWVSWSLSH